MPLINNLTSLLRLSLLFASLREMPIVKSGHCSLYSLRPLFSQTGLNEINIYSRSIGDSHGCFLNYRSRPV
jgi:hypothetical protein